MGKTNAGKINSEEMGMGACQEENTYRPVFFRIGSDVEKQQFEELVNSRETVICDTIDRQLAEWIKIGHPTEKLSEAAINDLVEKHLKGTSLYAYGVWVYYPWSKRMVHLLDEAEFVQLRTSRNLYKIRPEEITRLRSKKIGVIGLSVGQAIAQTLAMESICGHIHLADFDEIDLSNLNRLNAGIHEIGVNKSIVAARRIAELDPFIAVTCFPEGIHEENIDDFFLAGSKLDILVEECDGIDIKISSRLKARSLGIPVVMDTNDRGMLDIERFDLEPDRPLFHGGLDESLDLTKLKNLTSQEKLPVLNAMVDLSALSEKMKYSLGEMGKTINTWPQLASSVMLGGAMVADTCRRILLSETSTSGRYYVDFYELIK